MDLRKFTTEHHPTKKVFFVHGIPLSAISKAVGLSYGYVSNILSGNQPATPEVDAKLRKLAASLDCTAKALNRNA